MDEGGFEWPVGKGGSFAIGAAGGFFLTVAIALVVLIANPATPIRYTDEAADARPVSLSSEGADIATANGCLACHSADGTARVGPTWQGLFDSVRTFDDGTQATADATYLRTAIIDPRRETVEGFGAAVMPEGYGDRLSEADIGAIVDYIESLG